MGAVAPRGPGTRWLTQGAPMPARLPAAPFFSSWRHGRGGGKRVEEGKRDAITTLPTTASSRNLSFPSKISWYTSGSNLGLTYLVIFDRMGTE